MNRPNSFQATSKTFVEYTNEDPMRVFQHDNVLRTLGDVAGREGIDGGGGGPALLAQRLVIEKRIRRLFVYDSAPEQARAAGKALAGFPSVTCTTDTPKSFRERHKHDSPPLQADFAVFNLVLPYAADPEEDPEDLRSFFAETKPVLKRDGTIVATVLHEQAPTDVVIGNRRLVKLDGTRRRMEFLDPETEAVIFTSPPRQFPHRAYEEAARTAGYAVEWLPKMERTREAKNAVEDAIWTACEQAQLYALLVTRPG